MKNSLGLVVEDIDEPILGRPEKSGEKLELLVEKFCKENSIGYTRAKSGAREIDFIITKDEQIFYADCTNQNVGGSVEEKLPHKIWKYYKQYRYDEVYIITGSHKISRSVLNHCKEIGDIYGFIPHFVDLDNFTRIIK